MKVPAPLAYPTSAHVRKHSPVGYTNYRQFKPWLRDEFTFRCVYCLERERWYPSRADAFSVDHVVAQAADPKRILVCNYKNLVYACSRCNSLKRDIKLPDPTSMAMAACLSLAADGKMKALNIDGKIIIDILCLNESPVIDTRRSISRVIKLKRAYPDDPEIHELFLDVFGYPDDLPDLESKRPRGGKHRESAPVPSYHRLRQLNQLGEIY